MLTRRSMAHLGVSLVSLFLLSLASCDGGKSKNPAGYESSHQPAAKKVSVSTFAALRDTVANASPGDTVEVTSNIDFGDSTLHIRTGITLLGASGGTQIQLYDSGGPYTYRLIRICSTSSVVIRNLHINGTDGATYTYPEREGISIVHSNNVDINRCLIEEWSYAGVNVDSSSYSVVIGGTDPGENTIRHCEQRTDPGGYYLGYGVLVGSGATATISYNDFDFNRHDIACDGSANTQYVAHHNTSNNNYSHAFDVHGVASGSGYDNAGQYFYIHHNAFADATQKAIVIRGKPTNYALIEDNTFAHAALVIKTGTDSVAFEQQKADGGTPTNAGYGRIRIGHNSYTGTAPTDTTFQVSFDGNWNRLIATGWDLSDIAFGDFNDDGISDLFVRDGQTWKVSWSAYTTWKNLGPVSGVAFDDLCFYDCSDSDTDATDVLYDSGTDDWKFSDAGAGTWEDTDNYQSPCPSNKAIDDFDGDGSSDSYRRDVGI